MAGDSVVGASGMVAAWPRPRMAAAPTNATAEPPRKLRRESFITRCPHLLWIRSAACRRDHRVWLGSKPAAAKHGDAKVGRGEPEVPLGLDAANLRSYLLPRRLHQREGIDLHGVILQLCLGRDGLVQ